MAQEHIPHVTETILRFTFTKSPVTQQQQQSRHPAAARAGCRREPRNASRRSSGSSAPVAGPGTAPRGKPALRGCGTPGAAAPPQPSPAECPLPPLQPGGRRGEDAETGERRQRAAGQGPPGAHRSRAGGASSSSCCAAGGPSAPRHVTRRAAARLRADFPPPSRPPHRRGHPPGPGLRSLRPCPRPAALPAGNSR
nr:translation initiation factor IF-2-like [Taeniopygia guttata]